MTSLSHDSFNEGVYQWSLKMEIGKIYTFDKMKMKREDFINCITYLVSCGECLKFNNDMTKLTRFSDLKSKEYFNMKIKDAYDPLNSRVASIQARRETFSARMTQYTRERNKSFCAPILDPSKPFQNKLI